MNVVAECQACGWEHDGDHAAVAHAITEHVSDHHATQPTVIDMLVTRVDDDDMEPTP